jgi:hypothetical protein
MNEACPINYESLTVEEKRVLLARDVIEQLEGDTLLARRGWILTEHFFDGAPTDEQDAQDYARNKVCQVCAKGAILMAFIRRFDSFTIGELRTVASLRRDYHHGYQSKIEYSKIAEVFFPRMLAELEILFESDSFSVSLEFLSPDEIRSLVDFSHKRDIIFTISGNSYCESLNTLSPTKRLKKLMEMIIASEGRKLVLD